MCDYFLMNRAPTEPNESYKLNAPSDDQHQPDVGLAMSLCHMRVYGQLMIMIVLVNWLKKRMTFSNSVKRIPCTYTQTGVRNDVRVITIHHNKAIELCVVGYGIRFVT